MRQITIQRKAFEEKSPVSFGNLSPTLIKNEENLAKEEIKDEQVVYTKSKDLQDAERITNEIDIMIRNLENKLRPPPDEWTRGI